MSWMNKKIEGSSFVADEPALNLVCFTCGRSIVTDDKCPVCSRVDQALDGISALNTLMKNDRQTVRDLCRHMEQLTTRVKELEDENGSDS